MSLAPFAHSPWPNHAPSSGSLFSPAVYGSEISTPNCNWVNDDDRKRFEAFENENQYCENLNRFFGHYEDKDSDLSSLHYAPQSSLDRLGKSQKLLKSAREHGAKADSVRFDIGSGAGIGVFATSQVAYYQVVLSIPQDMAITVNLVNSGCVLCKEISDLNALFKMTLFMFEQYLEGPDSKWYEYLDSLPVDFSSLPRNFVDQDGKVFTTLYNHISWKPLSSSTEELDDFINAVIEKLTELRKSFPPNSTLILKRFYDSCLTRYFSGPKGEYLLPVLDMVNHGSPPNVKIDVSNNEYRFEAIRPISKLEEIKLFYGASGDPLNLFFDYGIPLEVSSKSLGLLVVNLRNKDSGLPVSCEFLYNSFFTNHFETCLKRFYDYEKVAIDPNNRESRETLVSVLVDYLREQKTKIKRMKKDMELSRSSNSKSLVNMMVYYVLPRLETLESEVITQMDVLVPVRRRASRIFGRFWTYK